MAISIGIGSAIGLSQLLMDGGMAALIGTFGGQALNNLIPRPPAPKTSATEKPSRAVVAENAKAIIEASLSVPGLTDADVRAQQARGQQLYDHVLAQYDAA